MVDPTSDIGDVDPEDAPVCAHCGAAVVGDSHQVRTRIVDDTAEHTHFCDDECLAAYEPASG